MPEALLSGGPMRGGPMRGGPMRGGAAADSHCKIHTLLQAWLYPAEGCLRHSLSPNATVVVHLGLPGLGRKDGCETLT